MKKEKLRKLIFLESYSPELDLAGYEPISLKPEISYDLKKIGKSYTIFEDLYSEDELRFNQDDYFIDELNFFDNIDRWIFSEIKFLEERKLTLCRSFFSRLKFTLDTIVIRIYTISKILEYFEPVEVVYASQKEVTSSPSISTFNDNALDLVRIITSALCEKRGITYSECLLQKTHQPITFKKNLKGGLLSSFKKIGAKNIQNFFKYKKQNLLRKFKEADGILFCDAGNKPVDLAIKDAIFSGRNVFLRTGQEIRKISAFFENKKNLDEYCPLSTLDIENVKKQLFSISDQIYETEKMDLSWVGNKAEPNLVAALFYPYLISFLRCECIEHIQETLQLHKFLCNNKISSVVTRGSTGKDQLSVLNAAKIAGTSKICLQHSCSILDLKDWSLDDLDLFDYYLASDSLSQSYFEYCSMKNSYLAPCCIKQDSRYLQSLAQKKHKSLNNSKHKKRLIYFPKKFPNYRLRFNTSIYPITWYFEFQKAIIDHFAKHTDIEFCYKHVPGQIWAENSIIKYITDLNLSHIKVESKPLVHYLGKGNKLLFDYPSTGLFEAVAAGDSVLCLCWDSFDVWQPHMNYFEPSISFFKTIDKGVSVIEKFIVGNKSDYLSKLEYSGDTFLKLLTNLNAADDEKNSEKGVLV